MKKKICRFFEFCGAYIIQEKLGRNWSKEFCFDKPENCVHFKNGPVKKKIFDKFKKSPGKVEEIVI